MQQTQAEDHIGHKYSLIKDALKKNVQDLTKFCTFIFLFWFIK